MDGPRDAEDTEPGVVQGTVLLVFFFFLSFKNLRYNSYTIRCILLNYNSVGFGTFTRLCNLHHYPIPNHFHHLEKNP